MNFCKECDNYISLYIDDMLDESTRLDFLKHMEECSECAKKFQEMSFISELCRETEDIDLPENFSSSLHTRFEKINNMEKDNKIRRFIYNRKLIAGLSTAAILVISLLAYNLLPNMGIKREATSMANDNAAGVQASSAAGSKSDSSAGSALSGMEQNAPSEKSAYTQFTDSKPIDNSAKSGKTTTTTGKDRKPAARKSNNKPAEASSESKKDNEQTALFSMKKIEQPGENKQQYFSNTVELNLKVSAEHLEIEELKKFMNELGAVEESPVTNMGIAANPAEDAAKCNYIDYSMPLSVYGNMEKEGSDKYKLEFSTKMAVNKKDITDEYNELNLQKNEIDKKITDAMAKGEDTAALEIEKIKISEKINDIIVKNDMISVRIFYIDK